MRKNKLIATIMAAVLSLGAMTPAAAFAVEPVHESSVVTLAFDPTPIDPEAPVPDGAISYSVPSEVALVFRPDLKLSYVTTGIQNTSDIDLMVDANDIVVTSTSPLIFNGSLPEGVEPMGSLEVKVGFSDDLEDANVECTHIPFAENARPDDFIHEFIPLPKGECLAATFDGTVSPDLNADETLAEWVERLNLRSEEMMFSSSSMVGGGIGTITWAVYPASGISGE